MLAFIRHGQTDWNRDDRLQGSSDIPLNDIGRAQAVEAAALLRAQRWDAVVSSPLSRARETARIIARELGLELGPAYQEFVERHYGPLEGESATETIRRWPNRDYPGAERLDLLVARALAGIERIRRDYPDQQVVVVCHGTIIRYTLTSIAGRAIEGIRNGSISTLDVAGEPWRVVLVNGEAFPAEVDATTNDTLNP